MSWLAIAVLVVGAYGFKLLGVIGLARFAPSVPDSQSQPATDRWFPAVVALIPAALFAALIAVQTLELDGSLQIDARLAGVAVAVVAARRRSPLVVVVGVAMAVTALIRWQTF